MPFDENGLYHLEDIAFCNTNQFTETARFFKKNGCYTDAPEGSKAYTEFWDIEEDRLKNGMKAAGKLITVERNGRKFQELQEVHITGENYGFLNYARILRTKEQDIKELRNHVVGHNSPLIKNARKVGDKDMDFPSFIDGQYHWFKLKEEARNVGLHVIMTKARRKGFSYMEGWDAALTVNMNRNITVIIGASDYNYITVGNQMMPMAKRYLDWLELKTDFNRGYLREAVTEEIKLGYKKPETGNMEYGYQSRILAISFNNGANPEAAIGKDGKKIKIEEGAKFPNLKKMLTQTLPTLRDGSIITGHMIVFGVVSSKESDWTEFEEVYYNPSAFGFFACDNVWDEGAKGNSVGFFYPQYIGDPLFVDEHGNSEKEAAIINNDIERAKWKKDKTAADYAAEVSMDARCPKEAFISGNDNMFPTAEISDHLNNIEHNPDYKYLPRYGKIVRTEKGFIFKQNVELEQEGLKIHDPITSFPIKNGQDLTGCYIEWISPYRDANGKIPQNLYRGWHDPYAHEKDKDKMTIRESLGVTYIYERPNNFTKGRGDYFIGAYIGRPPMLSEYNEHLENILEYVNGVLMFENDRGDVKGHFGRKNKLHRLADEPDLEFNLQVKGKLGRGKGMHINDIRKGDGAKYLRDWLMQSRGKDTFGNEKLNLHYIFDPGLLRELLKWNLRGNFDRVSACIVGMYDIKECFQKEIEMPPKDNSNSFFNRVLFSNR